MRKAALLLLVAALATACGDHARPKGIEHHLVFTKDVGLTSQSVWIADVDGHGARRLVDGSAGVISPDGHTVAYQSNTGGISLVSSRGGDSHRVADGVTLLAWTPDSKRILGMQGTELVVLDRGSGHSTSLDQSAKYSYGWSFSPDGQELVYDSAPPRNPPVLCDVPDLYVVRLSGGPPRRLTHEIAAAYPVWGPKGIVFSRFPVGCIAVGVWRIRPDGSGLRPIVARSPPRFAKPSKRGLRPYAWIAGGRSMLVGVRTIFGDDAAVLDTATKRLRKLGTFVDDVSRDGRFVVGTNRGANFPFSVAITRVAGGRPRVIASGRVCCADWNR